MINPFDIYNNGFEDALRQADLRDTIRDSARDAAETIQREIEHESLLNSLDNPALNYMRYGHA